jgi:hypothetical protein
VDCSRSAANPEIAASGADDSRRVRLFASSSPECANNAQDAGHRSAWDAGNACPLLEVVSRAQDAGNACPVLEVVDVGRTGTRR